MNNAENMIAMMEAAKCPLSANQQNAMIGAMAFYDARARKNEDRVNFIVGMLGDGPEADTAALRLARALSKGLRGLEALDFARGI